MNRLALHLLALFALSTPAWGATRSFTWAYGGKNFVEGETEAQLWVSNRMPDVREPGIAWWYNAGPVVGLTERVELAGWVVAEHPFSGSAVRMQALQLDARIQLLGAGWGEPERYGLVLNVAQALRMAPTARHGTRAVLAYERPMGAWRFALNAGADLGYGQAKHVHLEWAAAASWHVVELLELGFEAFGHQRVYSTDGAPFSLHYAGPLLTLVRGRVWWSTSVTFGPDNANLGMCARSNIGVAF